MIKHTRYVKKLNPFVEQWESVLDSSRYYLGDLLMFSESMQARAYIKLTESLNFKSNATQSLSKFVENFDSDRKSLKRIRRKQPEIEKAIIGLKGREWDGKTNLQQVYEQIKEQMKWIVDLLKFFKEDIETAKRFNNKQEVELIKQCVNDNKDYLKDLYQFYARSLERLEQLDRRLSGRA